MFVFDINMQGSRAVIFGHGLVTVSLVAEQVLQADEAINLSLAVSVGFRVNYHQISH